MAQPWKTWCRLCGSGEVALDDYLSIKAHTEIQRKIKKYLSIKDLQDSNFPDIVCMICHKILAEFDKYASRCEKLQDTFREMLSTQAIKCTETKVDTVSDGILTFDRSSPETIALIEITDSTIEVFDNGLKFKDSTNPSKLLQLLDESGELDVKDEVSSYNSDFPSSDAGSKLFEEAPKAKVRKRKKRKILNGKLKQNKKSAESGKRLLQEIVKDVDLNLEPKQYSDDENQIDVIKSDITTNVLDSLNKIAKKSSYLKYDCHICHEDCRNWHALCIHFRDVHNARAKVRCVCGKFLASRVSIGRHSAKHGKADSFDCSECDKRFPRASELEAHQVSHLPIEQRPYVCCKCARRFTSNQLLRHHERMHIPINQRMLHPCDLCDTKFATKSGLAMHIRAVHERLRPFVCDQCGRAFTTKGILEEHQVRHSDARPHTCDVCSKSFKTKQRLAIHTDTHGNTVYQCPHCPVKLNSRRTLRMHLFVHDEVCRYRCSFCSKEFKRAKDLKNHHNLHTGRRPYSCPWCARAFANGSNCRAHKRRMHPLELAAQEAGNTNLDQTMDNHLDMEESDKKQTMAVVPKIIHTTVKRKVPLFPIVRPNFVIPRDVTEKDSKADIDKEISPNMKMVKAEQVKEEMTSSDITVSRLKTSSLNVNVVAAQNDHFKYLRFQNSELSIIPIVECGSKDDSTGQNGVDFGNDNDVNEDSLHVPIIVSSFSKSPPHGCPFIQNSANQSLFLSTNSVFSRENNEL